MHRTAVGADVMRRVSVVLGKPREIGLDLVK